MTSAELTRRLARRQVMRYPITLTKDSNGTFLVTFPDVPEAVTFGETKDEALVNGSEALLTVFDAFMRDRKDIPDPSTRGTTFVELPALETTKIELYRAMREREVGKSELARRLDWHLPQVDRVLNVRHGSQLEQLEAAFGALGKRLVLTIVDAEVTRPSDSVTLRQRRQPAAKRPRVHGAVLTAARTRGPARHVSPEADSHRRGLKKAAKKR